MNKSDQLIQELIHLKLMKLCDAKKAKELIRKALEEVHCEAVLSTVMANNKINFIPPKIDNI